MNTLHCDRACLLPAFVSLLLVACSSSSTNNPSSADAGVEASAIGTPPPGPAACPVVVSATGCDPNTRPLIFVHGTYSSGTEMSHMAQLLGSNGFCQDRIVAIDYDSVAATAAVGTGGVDSPGMDCTAPNMPSGCGMIDDAVNAMLKKFPQFKQVDLAGHSQGTFHCGNYLANHSDKIAHYLNFSGTPNVGNVPTLSLSSQRDLFGFPHHAMGASTCAFQQTEDGGTTSATPVVADGGTTEGGAGDGGACNVTQYTFIHQDHFAVASSRDSFIQVYKFLTGKDPMYTDIQCGDDMVTVEGISETFADNVRINGNLEIREVSNTPRDQTVTPMTIMPAMGDTSGHFGPVQLKRNVQYVFTGFDSSGKRVGGWQYNTFKRDHHLVRLLSPASSSDGSAVGGLVAAQSTDHIVSSPTTTVLLARWAQGGFRQDLGASLTVNGTPVLTSQNAGLGAAMNMNLQGGIAALFMEDANKNAKTDLGLPYDTVFIAFTDVFIDATKPRFINVTFTAGSEDPATVEMPMTAENYASTDGIVEVIFP